MDFVGFESILLGALSEALVLKFNSVYEGMSGESYRPKRRLSVHYSDLVQGH